jgi:hypothetical protein
MKNNVRTQNSTEGNKGKKPYQTPRLFSYGNVREITQNVGNANLIIDGGTGATKKTM